MIKAILFDLDGVIIDSIDAHINAFLKIFQELGIKSEYDEVKKYFGHGAVWLIQRFFDANGIRHDAEKYAQLKDEYYRETISKELKINHDILDFLKNSIDQYKIAVCSATDKKNLELIMEKAGLTGIVDLYLGKQDLEENKPAPDIYLKAAELLDVSPDECLVIEDSPPGITAAKSAGMFCIALTATYPRDELGNADLIVESINEVDISLIEKKIRF